MLRFLAVSLAAACLAFPAMTSASPDWTGSFDPPPQEAYYSSYDVPAPSTESAAPSRDGSPWMWLAIGSSVVALGLAGVEIGRMRRSAHHQAISS